MNCGGVYSPVFPSPVHLFTNIFIYNIYIYKINLKYNIICICISTLIAFLTVQPIIKTIIQLLMPKMKPKIRDCTAELY